MQLVAAEIYTWVKRLIINTSYYLDLDLRLNALII